MSTAAIRINARLTGEDARRFIELTQGEGARAASDVLRDALREYYLRHAKARPNAFELMQASGYIGGFEAPADFSARYKDYLSDSLDGKLRHTVNEPTAPAYRPEKASKSAKPRKGAAK